MEDAHAGKPSACALLEEAGYWLGIAAASLASIFLPTASPSPVASRRQVTPFLPPRKRPFVLMGEDFLSLVLRWFAQAPASMPRCSEPRPRFFIQSCFSPEMSERCAMKQKAIAWHNEAVCRKTEFAPVPVILSGGDKRSISLPERRHASHRATIVDVAGASGFSASTVSIVLNEAPLSRYVAAGTKERIRAVAGDLGYRPDASARSLRSRRSHTIGIMVSDISDPFCTLILQGIEKALQPTTYLPVIMIAHNRREQFERHIEMMLERRVEGLVLVANWLFGEFDLLADIEKNQIPTFGVGRDLTASGIRSLQVDNEAGGYAAARHLYGSATVR